MEILTNAKIHFNNKILKKIVNVYQSENKYGDKPPGFGDFVKACFFLLQICKFLNLDFDVNFKNHPISNYIDTTNQEDYGVNYPEVEYPTWANAHSLPNGIEDFIKNLNNVDKEIYYITTNGWPILEIKKQGIDIIKSKIIPNKILENHINNYMKNLDLTKKEFITIHIRFDDALFFENNIDKNYLSNAIKKIINISNK